jgi:two-component system sensor histidine kinase QseC
MSRGRRSLQVRLFALVIGMVALVWLSTAVMTWIDVRHELDELLDGHLAQAAALLVARQAPEIDDDHGVDAPGLHRYAPRVAFQVFHEGRLALRSANVTSEPMVSAARGLERGFATVSIDGRPWRVFAAQGSERDVQVYVGEAMESRAAILLAVLRSTLRPMLVALPVLALVAWWAIRRGMTPLRQLQHSLARRPADHLGPVAVDDAPAEIWPVVDSLNDLFERIAILLDAERRFTADAAHELRTPIAAIRAQAQVAMAACEEAQRRHALEATLEGCDRAARLVDQLLTLARLEADAAPPQRSVDLAAIARQVVAEIAPRALGKEQTLELQAAPNCLVAGDADLLAVLVRNLVDNAVRYSPPSARVRVQLARDGARVVMDVEDSGPGLSSTELKRLGERFFRAAGSAESGSGLGWSIARRVAAAHRAELRPDRSASLGGLAVRVVFPSAQDAARLLAADQAGVRHQA